uniref:Protein NATD1 n=1 Tax=Acrobeloides nanus TaxID=290746 RepID=A0A914CIH8_9BILA
MYHTEVPSQFQGKGYAALLVKDALKYCKDNNLKVVPTCWYVEKYIREKGTPEEKNLVASVEERSNL